MSFEYNTHYDNVKCKKCGEVFEPMILNYSAEIMDRIESTPEEKGSHITGSSDLRGVSVIACRNCGDIIGVIPGHLLEKDRLD